MRVIGVVDVRRGQAVHARAGNRHAYAPVRRVGGREIAGDPIALARAYSQSFGLEEIYLADLDAIGGGRPQMEVLRALTSMPLMVWVDAGVSSPQAARDLLACGVSKVIVGLETLVSYDALERVVGSAGTASVAFSLDLKDAEVVVSADATIGRESPLAVVQHVVRCGAETVIVLDLGRVGLQQGPDVSLIADVRRIVPGITLIAGGGIRGPGDLLALQAAGCDAALVATALHEGQLHWDDCHQRVTRYTAR